MKEDRIEMQGLWPPSTPSTAGNQLGDEDEPKLSASETPGKKVRPLAIKLNNLFLWGSAGCFMPYLSVYFLHYTEASEAEFGRLMSIAAVVGTLLSFVVSSLSDRYRAHRLIYLMILLVNFSSVMLLFVPILASRNLNESPPQTTDELQPPPSSEPHHPEQPDGAMPAPTHATEDTLVVPSDTDTDHTTTTRPIWFYIISFCLAIGSLGVTIGMNFSDSFSANIARRCVGDESYGSIRFFGAFGWCLASLAMTQVDERASGLPYLFVTWVMFACLSSFNVLIVLCWPDKEPFNLSSERLARSNSTRNSIEEIEMGLNQVAVCQSQKKLSFGSRSSWLPAGKKTIDNEPIGVSIRFRRRSLDSMQAVENSGPEMRRFSVAVLGSSHVIEQFQLTAPKSRHTNDHHHHNHQQREALKRWPNEQNMNGVAVDPLPIEQHFRHITRIQPLDQLKLDTPRAAAATLDSLVRKADSAATMIDSPRKRPLEVIGFKLYLKIIELIARRNKNMIRFMVLYAVVGFIVAMNWYFLFPYLETLDEHKFITIAPYVMMSCYLSETLFFYVWPMLPVKVHASIGLSMVLFAFALRYLAYLTFLQFPADIWPLEMIVAVELLQSLTIGWFDCILNESAVEFALEAEHCLPKLVELNLVDDSRESAEMVKNSVKLSLVSLSSCFYDGIGVALGSLVGGLVIVRHDYSTLWLASAALALLVGIANLLLEWTVFSQERQQQQQQTNGAKLANSGD